MLRIGKPKLPDTARLAGELRNALYHAPSFFVAFMA